MPDREKIIEGLECCAAMSGDECSKCPYGVECRDTDLPYGMPHLASDALALLKKQQEEIENLKQTAQSMMEGICLLKKQEAVKPTWGRGRPFCGACGLQIRGGIFCSECGRPIAWEGR